MTSDPRRSRTIEKLARNFPRMTSLSRIGSVIKSSNVPMRFSSESARIVNSGAMMTHKIGGTVIGAPSGIPRNCE